ncbi:hypothetical protein [Streptomyces abikoensis]|uniref:hypothetical protein n=1 Tax=Streptomyces abikoensis TaxID=97398 RepID=UPI0033E4640E
MQPEPIRAVDIRPCLHYSTIQIVMIGLDSTPPNDGTMAFRDPALELTSHDASGYPLVRLEYHATPPRIPPGPWDYERLVQGLTVATSPLKLMSLTGPVEGEIDVPDGLYGLRVLRRANPMYEEPSDEEDEFIGDYDGDAPLGEPEECWLVQLWPLHRAE